MRFLAVVALLAVVELVAKAVMTIVIVLAVLQLSRWLLVYSERRRLHLHRPTPPLPLA